MKIGSGILQLWYAVKEVFCQCHLRGKKQLLQLRVASMKLVPQRASILMGLFDGPFSKLELVVQQRIPRNATRDFCSC